MQINKDILKNYILNLLPHDEHEELDEKMFFDEELSEQLENIEDELINNYLQNELSTLEAIQFEDIFFSSRKLEQKVAEAEAKSKNKKAAAASAHAESLAERVPWYERWKSIFHNPLVPVSALAIILAVTGGIVFLFRQNVPKPHIAANIAANLELLSTLSVSPPEKVPAPIFVEDGKISDKGKTEKTPAFSQSSSSNTKTNRQKTVLANNPKSTNQFLQTPRSTDEPINSEDYDNTNLTEKNTTIISTSDNNTTVISTSKSSPINNGEANGTRTIIVDNLREYLQVEHTVKDPTKSFNNKKILAVFEKIDGKKISVSVFCKLDQREDGQTLIAILPSKRLKKGIYKTVYYEAETSNTKPKNIINNKNILDKDVPNLSIPLKRLK